MALNLKKGQPMDLTKTNPGLTVVAAGCGWDVRKTSGQAFDLDVSAFLLGADDKVPGADGNLVAYFNNKNVLNGAVEHAGDNRTGEGEGDDETIYIDLAKVPANIDKVAITVTIHEWKERGQTFGMVNKAKINVYACDAQKNKGEVLGTFDLSEDGSTYTAVVMGIFYRHDGQWKFKAVGQGFDGGLEQMATTYGV